MNLSLAVVEKMITFYQREDTADKGKSLEGKVSCWQDEDEGKN